MTTDVTPGAQPVTQSVFRRAWEQWKRIAHAMGVFQTRLVMTILYFVVVLPLGLLVRLLADPLHLRRPQKSNWVPVHSGPRSLDEARQQF